METCSEEIMHEAWREQLIGLRDLQGALTRLAIENAARGEQPESSALPNPGALRGETPLSETDQREV
jgi:hypothetical protein